MARRFFFSFHHKADSWRTSQIRNIGAVEGNKLALDNDWEEIKKGGENSIKSWINAQMKNRSCVIILVGEDTASRPWINYEIKKAWDERKGLLGIRIHKLKDQNGKQSTKGANPFDNFIIENRIIRRKRTFSLIDAFGTTLSSKLSLYTSNFSDSKEHYKYVADNIEKWVEQAIEFRANN